MEIQQLRYVLAAAEHRSFTNAATAVHVTQPTLSHAVAKLESELRLELFHRSARGVTPTPAGDIVVEHARRVVAELDDLVTSVSSVHGITAGHLRIVSSHSFTSPIGHVMAAFRRRYPDIKMTVLHPRSNAAVYTLVATGECELAFARIDRAPSDVHTVELGAESLAVLLPPGTDPHPNQAHLTPAQVCALPLILPSAGNPTRVALDQFFTTHGAHLSAVIENDDYDSTLELARCGVGACLTTLTAPRVPRGTRVKAIYPPHETKIGLVYQHGKLDPAAAAFLRLTLAEFNGH